MLERTEIPEIQKGVNIIKDLSADAILRERIRTREDSIRDYNSAMSNAIKRGMAQGMAQGRAEGRAEGINDILASMRMLGYDDETLQKIRDNIK